MLMIDRAVKNISEARKKVRKRKRRKKIIYLGRNIIGDYCKWAAHLKELPLLIVLEE